MMCKPPAFNTASWRIFQSSLIAAICSSVGSSNWAISACQLPPNTISVPRPAMLVAIVTAPVWPACATMSASMAWNLAFSTLWSIPAFVNSRETTSDFSIEIVPTSTGWPLAVRSRISSMIAPIFSSSVI
ncbi:hypothetical protein D3C79_894970 [compost metagenome]